MKSLKTYIEEVDETRLNEQVELVEKLITFDGKAYPKFGNVVIMAGGAGSGKGFVKDKLLGIEGFVFDVDALKKLVAAAPRINKSVKDEMDVDLKSLGSNLKNTDNVSKLHTIVADYLGIDDRKTQALYQSILTADPDRKPNIIFDVTLKDLRKLEKLTSQVQALNYDKRHVHIVWVVNDIEVAKAQNKNRDRTVDEFILVNTHRGASNTMKDIVKMGKSLNKYMDGDIVFAFNKVGVDGSIAKSGKGGMYLTDANYFYVKRAGKPVLPLDKISKDVRMKIQGYVPKDTPWV